MSPKSVAGAQAFGISHAASLGAHYSETLLKSEVGIEHRQSNTTCGHPKQQLSALHYDTHSCSPHILKEYLEILNQRWEEMFFEYFEGIISLFLERTQLSFKSSCAQYVTS